MRYRYLLILLAHFTLVACGEDSNQESRILTADATINSPDGGLGPIPVATSRYAKSSLDDGVNGPAFTTVADLNDDGRLDLIVSEFGNLEAIQSSPARSTYTSKVIHSTSGKNRRSRTHRNQSTGLTQYMWPISMVMATKTSPWVRDS